MDLSSGLSCEDGSFSHHCNPHRFLQPEVLRLCCSCWNPRLRSLSCSPIFLQVNPHTNVGPPATALPAQSSSSHLSTRPLCPGCPSPALLPIWMYVSSLSPWLSDFDIVQFSGISGYFWLLNLLLSSFWLCEEAMCIYPHLHLGRKSSLLSISKCSLKIHFKMKDPALAVAQWIDCWLTN